MGFSRLPRYTNRLLTQPIPSRRHAADFFTTPQGFYVEIMTEEFLYLDEMVSNSVRIQIKSAFGRTNQLNMGFSLLLVAVSCT